MTDDDLVDLGFAALADPVRRAIIARLSRGSATVNEIAEPFEISLQAVSKHIQVLEHAGLVTRTREAQRRPVHLNPDALEALTAWIDRYRLVHEQRYRRLDAVLAGHHPHHHTTPTRRRHEQHPEPRHPGRRAVDRLHPRVRRPRGGGLRRPPRPREGQAVARPARLRDGHRAWDFTTGGGYRYQHRTDHGTFGFRGVFHTIRENEFALQTFEFDGAPDEVALEFMWFEDLGDGRTRLRGRSIGRTVEGRDAMVESGMEKGMVEGYDRLEAIVGG